jgi:hypothetical protein
MLPAKSDLSLFLTLILPAIFALQNIHVHVLAGIRLMHMHPKPVIPAGLHRIAGSRHVRHPAL